LYSETAAADRVRALIRDVPDFPKAGIVFKDITTVLKDPEAFRFVVDRIACRYRGRGIKNVVCVEARGFVLGSAVAYAMGAGLVPVRKKGKLPGATYRVSYELEYGTDYLEIHRDALKPGEVVLVVDDLLATGGTVKAALDLLAKLNVRVTAAAFFVELSFLNGRAALEPLPVFSVVQFS
jgi:adenine phosphoribosyltransferase